MVVAYVFMSDCFTSTILKTDNVCTTFEYVCIYIIVDGISIILCTIYNSPSSNNFFFFVAEFAMLLSFINYAQPTAEIILAGDFNLGLQSKKCCDFTHLLLTYFIYAIIFSYSCH